MSYATEVLADSPAAYYRLTETSGTTLADSSPNGRPFTVGGTVTLNQTGPAIPGGKAISVAGAGYVYTTDAWAFSMAAAYSVEIWVKYTTTSNFLQFICNDKSDASPGNASRAWQLRTNAGKVQFEFYNSAGTVYDINPAATYNDNNWHHLVVAVAAGTATLYVDGSSVGTASYTGTLTPGSKALCAGANSTFGVGDSLQFTGSLAEIAIYPSALSATRVAAHFNPPASTAASGSGSLTLSGTATAAAGASPASGTGALTLTGSATARSAASAAGSLSLSGTATVSSTATASGTGTLTLTGTAVAAATSAGVTRSGSATIHWQVIMLEGVVFGATAADDAFLGSPADDPTYGTPIPDDDPGGDTATDGSDDGTLIPPADLGPGVPDGPDDGS